MSTTFTPLIDDPQKDIYRKKQFSPEDGQQFTNPFGTGSISENATGNPADRDRTLPSDGGVGDKFPSDANADGLLPESSPLRHFRPTHVSPYNNMQAFKKDDPYEVVRKRRHR